MPTKRVPLVENIEGGLAAIISGGLSWISKEGLKLINIHVWQPLLTELVTLCHNLQSVVQQIVVGLCGLIPELGGVGCSAISAPIGVAFSSITAQLLRGSVQGLITNFEGWWLAKIPSWSLDIADGITELAEDAIKEAAKGVDAAVDAVVPANVISGIEASVSKMVEDVDAVLVPLYKLASPIILFLMKLIIPKITQGLFMCGQDLDKIVGLIEEKLCTPAVKKS